MQTSSAELESKLKTGTVTGADINLEVLDPASETYVEMDIGLGVFEHKDETPEDHIIIPGLTSSPTSDPPKISELDS
jgi:hypothetical protein